ncbi:hypothetical protein EJ06DRAFT_527420 [Trichodelitschia bisporula]|uniref:Uncharacterized protein n=1 Tax=Trichodelitschia bisporula TaxID=703511 RepID=A0A6G1I6R4_9PEZI|nr:hypothetical protein EJ06DRAFT_527420 [Trichodelitschia bisporula]
MVDNSNLVNGVAVAETIPVFTPPPVNGLNGATEQPDVEMKEEPAPEAPMPSLPPAPTIEVPTEPSPQPQPQPQQQLQAQPQPQPSSQPPTARGSPHPSTPAPAPPPQPNHYGSQTRVYLNQKVTPHLLEGMKHLAVYEPEKPLQWLSEFLAQRSREMEGT